MSFQTNPLVYLVSGEGPITSTYPRHTAPVVVAKHRAQVKQCQELLAKFSPAELRSFFAVGIIRASQNMSQQLDKETY